MSFVGCRGVKRGSVDVEHFLVKTRTGPVFIVTVLFLVSIPYVRPKSINTLVKKKIKKRNLT